MDNVKAFHVWMPDGRSLCDRRVHLPGDDVGSMSDAEFEAYVAEQTEAPACGSCILIADRIRFQAATLLRFSGRVHPSTTREALIDMQGTRWQPMLNLNSLQPLSASAASSKFDRVLREIPEDILSKGVERFAVTRRRMRDHVEAYRTKVIAAADKQGELPQSD